ncbi:MAG TPA: sulfite exporter TauE/SafE family protein [Firmicutes bacterium]|nr:sulfite exporter TauE/SafE family protein [Bacillota bacterium]
MLYAILGVTGLAAGILSALLGVGGGIIMVPAMTYCGVPFKVAVGTSLAVIIPTSLMGVIRHYNLGNVDFKVALLLATGAVIGANLGVMLVARVPDLLLKRLFAVFMVVTAIKLFTGK